MEGRRASRSEGGGAAGGGQSSYMEKAARSSISGTSSITNRPSHMKRRDGPPRRDKADAQVRVIDPEDKNLDRTPHSLLRQPVATTRAVARRKGDKGESTTGVVSPSSVSVAEDRSGEKGSVSRMESSDSGSESSRIESSVDSDEDESLTGIERLALDDTAETSSLDSRIPEDKKKKKGAGGAAAGGGASASADKDKSEETSEEGLLSKLGGGRETPTKDKPKKGKHGAGAGEEAGGGLAGISGKKRELNWQEKKQWREAPGTVTLSETPTFFLLEKPDEQICIGGDSVEEDTLELRKRFERYSTFCAHSKGNDRYGTGKWRAKTK